MGGTIAGLAGSGLVLQNNGADDLAASNDGTFTFTTRLADATAYDVTVLRQPTNPLQSCTVANGSGTVAGGSVSNVAVTCVTGAFVIRGTVSGLAGSGLVLQNNGGDDLPVSADGGFSFLTPVASGEPFSVTVKAQPTNPSQRCTVENASGTVGAADVEVQVTCVTGTFAIGGNVTGMLGSALVLQNNGGDDLDIAGNGPFTFRGLLASDAPYNVTVKTHPTNPTQSCAVRNATGTVASASIANITVACETNRFAVGGAVSGLEGRGLVLQLSGGNDIQITTNGNFAFPVTLPSGTPYVVSIRTQPTNPAQTCTLSNAIGVVSNANVTSIRVSCTTRTFRIGGTVADLAGSGLVLQNNGRGDLAIASNGSFTFDTPQASGTQYRITVRTQPSNPTQTCTVANGTGIVGSGDVRSARVTCATSTFRVSGTVSGLSGAGLVLQNSGGDVLQVTANGAFAFTGRVASGSPYNVTVRTQPSNPAQACTVVNGSGTVSSADVTNVQVSCSTSSFTVGGTVQGLSGSGLVLQNNGRDDLRIDADGRFTFATAVPSGSTYNVTVASQPGGPTQSCAVSNGSGSIVNQNVDNVEVRCTTTEFTVGGTVAGLSGTGLVLQNNGSDDLAIASNGGFAFRTSLLTGSAYLITVRTQPSNPVQTCAVVNGSGTVGSAHVTSVQVNCDTSRVTIGGTVRGLAGSGLILRNNGGDDLAIPADGSFTFPTQLAVGSTYDVTVAAQPTSPAQTCTVSNASGTANSNVANIDVTCTTAQFTIGGTVSGLSGTGLVLQNNGADDLAITSNGSFTFATPLTSGSAYGVTVAVQPTSPAQTCTVANGAGVVASAAVTDVAVSCIDD